MFANPVSPLFLQFFLACLGDFPGGLVSFGCRCGAGGFPLRAERRVKVRRSFLVLRGFVVMWGSFSYFRSFLVCLGDSLLQFLFTSCGLSSRNLIFGCMYLVGGGGFPFRAESARGRIVGCIPVGNVSFDFL